jgi:phage-related protein
MRVPATEVLYYREKEEVPLLKWLVGVPPEARLKCLARLSLLEARGHELRRPVADYLGDGIYELRAKARGVNFRILYFFHGRNIVIVSHGIVKQRATVPSEDIATAAVRKYRFEQDPLAHTFRPES